MQPDCVEGRVVCGTIYEDMHYRDLLGINCKSRVVYPGPKFLSSVTWPLMHKKHSNELIKQSINFNAFKNI